MGMKFRSNSTGPALASMLLIAAVGVILTIIGMVQIVRGIIAIGGW